MYTKETVDRVKLCSLTPSKEGRQEDPGSREDKPQNTRVFSGPHNPQGQQGLEAPAVSGTNQVPAMGLTF